MGSTNQSTSASLLARLKSTDDVESWNRFVELYTPLIFYWTKSHGISSQEAADVVQEVLLSLVKSLPSFEYEPSKQFRGWLLQVTVSRVRDHQRKRGRSPRVDAAGDVDDAVDQRGGIDVNDEAAYRQFIVSRCFELMKPQFRDDVWEACYQQVVQGREAADVAEDLRLTLNQVYLAKSRVLARIRGELAGLLDG